MKKIIRIVCIVLASIILLLLPGYFIAPAFIFHPVYEESAYNELLKTEGIQPVTIESERIGSLNGWFVKNTDGPAPTIIYFGGRGDDTSGRILWLLEENAFQKCFSGSNFLAVDYPSYGKSEGRISTKNLMIFAEEVYDYARSRSDVSDISVLGYSLGTGSANYVASVREVTSVTLFAPFAEMADLYNNFFNIFYGPLRLLIKVEIDSMEYVKNITAPVTIYASKRDEVVPFESTQKLIGCCKVPPKLIYTDTSHDDFWNYFIISEA